MKTGEGIKEYSKEQLNNIYNGSEYSGTQLAATPTIISAIKISGFLKSVTAAVSGGLISGGFSAVSSYITSAWAKCR